MDTLKLTGCAVDLTRLVVTRDAGISVRLTAREGELLAYLSAHRGRDVPRRELLSEVWGYSDRVESRAVDSTVQRLRGKIEPDPKDPTTLLTVPGGYRLALPARAPRIVAPTRLFGRSDELDALTRWADDGGLLVLVGPPGTGKSRLAVEIGARLPFPTVRVALGGARDADDLVAALADALAVPLGGGDPASRLGRALAARGDVLLVLDDAEAVTGPLQPMASTLREHAPRARLLVTSRHRLDGEPLLALGPLDPDAATALFVDRARMARPTLSCDPALVAELVDRLDRLPLAIELAAARVRVLGLRQILDRLDQQLRLLGGSGAAGRATLTGAIAGSWELLSLVERRVLAGSAVFRGGFTEEAADAVLGPLLDDESDLREILDALVSKSLLRAEPQGRLAPWSAVAAFADAQPGSDRAAAEARHRAFFGGLGRSLRDSREIEAAAVLAPERANLVVALQRAVQASDPVAAPLALALVTLHSLRGPVDRGAVYADAALAVDLPAEDRFALLDAVARCTYRTRGLDRALEASEEAIAVAEALSPSQQAAALHARALVMLHAGRPEEAERCLLEGRSRADEAGDVRLQALCRSSLGHVAIATGRPQQAEAAFSESLAFADRRQETQTAALAHGNLANLARRRGDLDAAERHYDACLSLARAARDRVTEAMVFNALGVLAYNRRQYERAVELLKQGHARMAALGLGIGGSLGNLALALRAMGRLAEAREIQDAALLELRREGYVRQIAIALCNRAQLHLLDGALHDARRDLEEALERVGPDDRLVRGAVLGPLAEIEARTSDPEQASRWFDEGERLLIEAGDRYELAMLRARRGWAAARDGRLDDARSDLQAACDGHDPQDPEAVALIERLARLVRADRGSPSA